MLPSKMRPIWLCAALLWPTLADQVRARELSLEEALTLGMRRAPALHGTRAQRKATRARIDERRANYLPSANAAMAGSAEVVRATEASLRGNYVSARASLALQWTLYDFGRTTHWLTAAEADDSAAQAAVRHTALQTRAAIAETYLSAYYSRHLRKEIQATIAQRQQLLAIAQGLVQSGLQPPLEGLRAAARVTHAQLQLAALRADEKANNAALSISLGLSPSRALRLRDPGLSAAPIGTPMTSAVADLPSVQLARMQVRSARAFAQASRAEYLPAITLSLGVGLERLGATSITTDADFNSQLLFTVPLFDASVGARVRAAEAEAIQSHSQLAQRLRDAQMELTQAQVALEGARRATAVSTEAAEQAQAVLQIVKTRYTQGLCSPIELIEAESTEAEARLQRVQSLWDVDRAVIRLLTATGRSLQEVRP